MVGEKELSALVAAHSVWLSALLRGLTACEADAEDAFQEVWLRVIKGGGPTERKAERVYLTKIARSVVIDRYRKISRYELTVDEDSKDDDEPADLSPSPSERFECAATREEVLSAIRELPTQMRDVILMRIEGELTFQEIADTLEIPLGTVLTWMHRATARLRQRLEEK